MDSVRPLLFACVISVVLCDELTDEFTNQYSHYNVHHTNMCPPTGYRPMYAMGYTTFRTNDTRGKLRTRIHGITIVDDYESILFHASEPTGKEFHVVREQVGDLISCRLLVGHGLIDCLNILKLRHPVYLLRDTTYFCDNCSNVTHAHDSLEKIAKEFLKADLDAENATAHAVTALRVYKKFEREWEIHNLNVHKTAFALDCEMIECLDVSRKRKRVEAVARVSVVDHVGNVVYDNLIQPELPVSSYRTFITGLNQKNLTRAANFSEVSARLNLLLKGHILVGHDVNRDLALLKIKHPIALRRDSSKFVTFRRMFPDKKQPSLKELARTVLNMTIQAGYHDSIQDAYAAMKLYLRYRRDWDEEVMKQM